MQRLLYISESTIEPLIADATVAQIVEVAKARNANLNVTGALLFTEKYFAQLLEGTADAIDALMDSIKADPRHTNIVVVDHSPTTERKFPAWSMAYHGQSAFVSRHISQSLQHSSKSEKRRTSEWIIELMSLMTSGRLIN